MTLLSRSAAFEDVLEDVTSGNTKTLQSDYQPVGRYPVVDQGQSLIAGYLDDEAALCRADLPVIVFGDHTKALKFVDFPFCIGADGTKVLRPKCDADPKYVFHYLRSLKIPDAGYSRHYKFLKRFDIPLPPLTEQRRIAAILDAVDALRQKRRQALRLLDQLTQAIFVEMFGDLRLNERNWPTATVADFVAGFESGKNLVGDDEDDEDAPYRVLKVSAVTSLSYRPEESKPLPRDYVPPPSHVVRTGDLLFSRANTAQLVGATALVTETPDNCVLPDKIWRFAWHERPRADPYFVWYLFQQRRFREEISRRATGTSGSMKNISQEKVLSIPVALPPLRRQREFAARASLVSRQRHAYEIGMERQDRLFTSLQHRAFRGEL